MVTEMDLKPQTEIGLRAELQIKNCGHAIVRFHSVALGGNLFFTSIHKRNVLF